MVTNGVVLSKSTFQRLLDINIFEFQITLDGEEKEHNKRRFFKNGNGSFNKIYNNIKSICNTKYKEQYSFNIRVNIDKRNEKSLWLLMDKLEQDGLNDKINIYIKPVHNWENEASLLCLSTEEFAKYEIDFYSRKILNNYKNASALLPPRLFTTCMATSNGTMELVDIKGNLFNCNEMPFIERLEKFALGNVSNSNVNPDLYELDKWYDKVEDNTHSNCSNCALLPVCGGYCPKHWIDGNKDVCPSIKHNIKDLLQLKYLLTQNA